MDERPAEQDIVQDGAAHDERLGEHLVMEAITGHQRPESALRGARDGWGL